jgi:hypothetical protein
MQMRFNRNNRGGTMTKSVDCTNTHCGCTHDKTANPAPFGLLCLSMTLILYGLHFMKTLEMNTLFWMTALFATGLGQFVTGLMEWKKGNSFGTTAFLGYGIFWFIVIFSKILNALNFGVAESLESHAAFLLVWGGFTAGLYYVSFYHDRKIQYIFATLTLAFLLLAFSTYKPEIMIAGTFTGIMCIICGILSAFAAFSFLIDESCSLSQKK